MAEEKKATSDAKKDEVRYDLGESMDLVSMTETVAPELDCLFPGFVQGTVGSLVAPGATGKSFWSMQAAACVAVPGLDMLGLGPCKENGDVLVLAAEDPKEVLHQRIHAMGSYLSSEQRQYLRRITWKILVGKNVNIMVGQWFRVICEAAKGKKLIIIDTLTRFHSLEEKEAADMKNVLAQFEALAAATGACVLFLHHTSKGAALNGQGDLQQASSGSRVLTDNVRWCGNLVAMDPKEADKYAIEDSERLRYVRYVTSKQNYGERTAGIWYERCRGGILVPVPLTPVPKEGRAMPPRGSGSAKPRKAAVQVVPTPEPRAGVQPHLGAGFADNYPGEAKALIGIAQQQNNNKGSHDELDHLF